MSSEEIQRRFNAGGFAERALRGELRQHVFKSKPCSLATEPPGTLSQMIAYFDGTEKVAIVHQYLRPDGTIGASDRPDPKLLLDGDDLIYC